MNIQPDYNFWQNEPKFPEASRSAVFSLYFQRNLDRVSAPIREKTQLPEREYREYLEAQAQRKKILPERTAGGGSGNGAGPAPRGVQETEVISAESATALDHARGLERGFRYYQALEKQQMQAAKRRTLALRELERWNKGLGRRARELSDRFIWAETICPTQPPAQAAPALARVLQSLRA
jgi:hypothetical protein